MFLLETFINIQQWQAEMIPTWNFDKCSTISTWMDIVYK